jgi:hypothetical protein
LDLGSSQILHYGPVAGADALLFPSANTDVDIATSPEVVDSFNPTGDGTVMWLYTVRSNSGANVRGGTIIVAWDDSGGTVTGLAESATSPEIGDTSGVTFTADMSGGLVRLLASVTTDNWSVYAYRIAIGNGFVL